MSQLQGQKRKEQQNAEAELQAAKDLKVKVEELTVELKSKQAKVVVYLVQLHQNKLQMN